MLICDQSKEFGQTCKRLCWVYSVMFLPTVRTFDMDGIIAILFTRINYRFPSVVLCSLILAKHFFIQFCAPSLNFIYLNSFHESFGIWSVSRCLEGFPCCNAYSFLTLWFLTSFANGQMIVLTLHGPLVL